MAAASNSGSLGAIDYRKDEAAELNFLLKNRSAKTQMPKSFYVTKKYWEAIGSLPDKVENLNERILATYGQNIYDGATWQIALAMMGKTDIASEQTVRLLSGKSGNLSIRASAEVFVYGDKKLSFPEKEALFFRMISDEWEQADPLTGKGVTWMDWKPILGENGWAALIGPLQVAYVKYKGHIPLECDEMKLALSILPALKAMQSPIGAVYHTTGGVYGKSPHDISSENNASLYAGLKMLKQVLQENKDPQSLIASIDILLTGIEKYFREYAFDRKQEIFLQGGLYNDPSAEGKFLPSKDFAVDVQTWTIKVFGAKKIDEWFGEKAANRIWQNTKKRGGYYEGEILKGVGYTDDPSAVLSVEWTLGAILLVNELNDLYKHPELVKEAASMRAGVEALKEKVVLDGTETVAFHYADRRYNIPFGWWANKIPSLTSTAWAMMIDRNFNPFVLGGGKGV